MRVKLLFSTWTHHGIFADSHHGASHLSLTTYFTVSHAVDPEQRLVQHQGSRSILGESLRVREIRAQSSPGFITADQWTEPSQRSAATRSRRKQLVLTGRGSTGGVEEHGAGRGESHGPGQSGAQGQQP